MFGTYLRRELLNRKKQTVIVAAGMAFAIALVMTVSAVSTGVQNSQNEVLGSLYGIGTDITVTQTAEPGTNDGPRRFDFGSDVGTTADGKRVVDSTRLERTRGSATFDAATVSTISSTQGVGKVATSLLLSNTTFKGELPEFRVFGGENDRNVPGQDQQGQQGDGSQQSGPLPTTPGNSVAPSSTTPAAVQSTVVGAAFVQAATTTTLPAPTGGSDGKGGAAFQVTSFSVMGVDPGVTDAGPLSSTEVAAGRALATGDKGKYVAVLDSTFATTETLEVGATILVAKKKFEIVGTVQSNSATSETAANVFVPLDVAQSLSGNEGVVTNVYVKATSGDMVDSVATALRTSLPEATVSTTADLASSVSGSLSTASDLLDTLGKWLSIIVLVVAFLVATLFTMSGVSRRTREFGTLKAIGWRNGRIVRQVAGESIVQGTIGGAVGVGLGFAAIAVFNSVAPALEASTAGLSMPSFPRGGNFGPPGGDGGTGNGGNAARMLGRAAGNSYEVVLRAATTPSMILVAVGLAVMGGVIAGVFGGLRAARLRPAEAMRSVA